jgi:hypothetical protein
MVDDDESDVEGQGGLSMSPEGIAR